MSSLLADSLDRATAEEVVAHLRACDARFVPPLSSRVNLDAYAAKLVDKARRVEVWDGNVLVGFIGMYCQGEAFISNVSVDPAWGGKRIGSRLLQRAIELAAALGSRTVTLEVAEANQAARQLYDRSGFLVVSANAGQLTMQMVLTNGENSGEPA